MRARKFSLFLGCLGNGITVCNKAVMERGDFKMVAHISTEGAIKWYVPEDYCPPEDRERIEAAAAQQRAEYEKWWNSLPEAKRYAIELDRMSITELVEHLRKKREAQS